MRVLVTGWAGYLGPHVVRLLKERGHYVIGLDTGWYLTNFAEPPVYPDEAIFSDARSTRLYPTVEAVVHLAGLSNDPLGNLDPWLTREINIGVTAFLYGYFDGTRQVVASSCSVYGTRENASEASPLSPLTEYAKAKADVDLMVQDDDRTASLRFGTLYGYSPGHRLDLVVNRMVWDATRTMKGIHVYGDAARPLTHVEDAARAIVQAVESPLMRGIYNVAGENWRMQELGKAVKRVIEDEYLVSPRLVFEPGGADARDYSASSDKLLATGFTFEHGVIESLPALIRKTMTVPGYAPRYVRLDAIKNLIDKGYLDSQLRHKEKVA